MMKIDHHASRLYGLMIHNLTERDSREVVLEAVDKFQSMKPPFKCEYGDVVVLQPHNDISQQMGEILFKLGYIIDYINPNTLYTLKDSFVSHYVFVDKPILPKVMEKFIYDWETSHRINLKDRRMSVRYVKVFILNSDLKLVK